MTITAGGLATVTADSVTVKYNSDAVNAVNLGTLDIDGVTAPLSVSAGVVLQGDQLPGLLRGLRSHRRRLRLPQDHAWPAWPASTRIEVVASNASVSLSLGKRLTAPASSAATWRC